MSRFTVLEAERLAEMFRAKTGVNLSEPIGAKTLLRKLKITTMYRPLSENSYGISCKSKSGRMFMMVNSNSTRGRQHFTIAHELYHLFYDESPVPHMCRETISEVERNAIYCDFQYVLRRSGPLDCSEFP